MAKRKTPKGDKIVDLKPKAEKITDEQLTEIQRVVSTANQIKLEVGNTEARKFMLLKELDKVNAEMQLVNSSLEEEYGKVDVNVSDGTIRYVEDEQVNS